MGINLANQTGREGKLSAAYKAAADQYAASGGAGFRLVPFDFHKQCGATNYARLSLLWDEIGAEFERFGYFFRDGAGASAQQTGVFRTNCIDCLDRTNVVQVCVGGWVRAVLLLVVVVGGGRVAAPPPGAMLTPTCTPPPLPRRASWGSGSWSTCLRGWG